MTIHQRMVPRSEREKDLLKYGRGQERERIIKLLESKGNEASKKYIQNINPEYWGERVDFIVELYELIKGEK